MPYCWNDILILHLTTSLIRATQQTFMHNRFSQGDWQVGQRNDLVWPVCNFSLFYTCKVSEYYYVLASYYIDVFAFNSLLLISV